MKTKAFLLASLACAIFACYSCNDDDNNYQPDDIVLRTFETKYPDASRIEWENKAGYKVADFRLDSYETEAWFQNDGSWLLTETDIPYNNLPQVVKTSFEAGTYASWRIDDVDKLERPDVETVFVIEVESGNQEIDLYYSEDGTLIKEINDEGNNIYEPIPVIESIIEDINKKYPNAKILDIDNENSHLEFDILHDSTKKEVVYSNNEWIYTKWEVRQSQVPEVVMTALKNSQYNNYRIDDIDIYEKADGLFYVFELESGNQEIKLTIKSDGTIS
ncbi:MAG: PepSY-like domain-containing protein [Tannerella sp.]|jgi:uncharacterized membrane protein YkoI|nr:PepSY-like domain-containing protein [Tannerella sp.]